MFLRKEAALSVTPLSCELMFLNCYVIALVIDSISFDAIILSAPESGG
jgi:hypothetical protein